MDYLTIHVNRRFLIVVALVSAAVWASVKYKQWIYAQGWWDGVRYSATDPTILKQFQAKSSTL